MYFATTLICSVFILAPQKSLGEEVNELTSSRLLKLEKENQALLKKVEDLKGTASQDNTAKLTKANQENQKLNQKVSLNFPVTKKRLFGICDVFISRTSLILSSSTAKPACYTSTPSIM